MSGTTGIRDKGHDWTGLDWIGLDCALARSTPDCVITYRTRRIS